MAQNLEITDVNLETGRYGPKLETPGLSGRVDSPALVRRCCDDPMYQLSYSVRFTDTGNNNLRSYM